MTIDCLKSRSCNINHLVYPSLIYPSGKYGPTKSTDLSSIKVMRQGPDFVLISSSVTYSMCDLKNSLNLYLSDFVCLFVFPLSFQGHTCGIWRFPG